MKKLKKNDSANKNKKEEKQKKKTTNRLKQIKWTNSLKEKKNIRNSLHEDTTESN